MDSCAALDRSFGEPKAEFSGRCIGITAAVGEVVVNAQRQVASDSAGSCVEWIGGTHHGSDRLYRIGARDGDGDDWSANEVIADILEEGPFAMLSIMGFDGGSLGIHELESGDFKVSGLDSFGDLSNEVAGHSARLN